MMNLPIEIQERNTESCEKPDTETIINVSCIGVFSSCVASRTIVPPSFQQLTGGVAKCIFY